MPRRTIAVVDGNSLIHRAFHALPPTMTAPDGRPTNAAFGFISMLVRLVQELSPHGVVVAFDRGKPAFRTEALEQYKVHRPPTADELKVQFPIVKDLLAALAVPVLEIDGWEGDDILGTFACKGAEEGYRVLLVTGDRDAFQLVNDSVSVVTTKKGISDITVYGPAEVEERYGVTPAQVPDYLGLKGDPSDNIPGVPGIGEKTAARLLQQYGTLENLVEHADEVAGKLGENLRANIDAAFASRTVATIMCDLKLDIDLDAVEWGGFDPAEVAKAFGELRFTSLLERVLATGRREEVGGGEPDGDDTAVGADRPTMPLLTGREAAERVRQWIAAAGTGKTAEWLGVALDDGSAESLFADRRDVAVAGPDATCMLAGEDGAATFSELLERAHVAAPATKPLLHELCAPRVTAGCDFTFDLVDPARLFDCAIGAYLLESARSSYDIASLAADYRGVPLDTATDAMPRAAIEARAAAGLAREIGARLEADGSERVFRDIEMPLVPVLARMERVGVGLDTKLLADLATETRTRIDELVARIHADAGVEFNIDSPKQLAEVLFEKLGLPTGKRTKTGYSTDSSVLSALAPKHPVCEKILTYRELAKLMSTYIEALPRLVAEDGRIHTSFNQTVAATGRLSSSSPNLQNIPVRTEFGRRIRAAFVPAEPGDVMLGADYSQIELRILAHLSADEGLIEAFTRAEDFHAATAARVFGLDPDQVTPAYRSRAKAVNFGIVYGQSAHGLAASLGIGHAEAQEMIDRYYAAYPGVRAYLDETVAAAHRDGVATTLFGRKRRIPELKSGNYNVRAFGERTAMNHPMQGTAADIMKLAMIEVDRRLRAEDFRSRMVLQVHDELVFETPTHEVDRVSAMVREAMSGVVELAVPLEVDIGYGSNWADAK